MRHPRARGGAGIRDLITRRRFLVAAAGFAIAPVAFATPARRALAAAPQGLSPELETALAKSGFVYVSPLRADGQESRCHGEVWYAWLDGAVVLTSASTSWKARAARKGLRARIWVGDYGRAKTLGIGNEAFRKGPRFDARAEIVKDAALVERMLAVYEEKYPREIASWRDKMRAGNADGSRVLLRYAPLPPTRT